MLLVTYCRVLTHGPRRGGFGAAGSCHPRRPITDEEDGWCVRDVILACGLREERGAVRRPMATTVRRGRVYVSRRTHPATGFLLLATG